MASIIWTEAAIRDLGVRTDVATAGSIFGLSRTQSYEAVRHGRFPVPVIPVGRRLVVPTAPIRQILGIASAEKDEARIASPVHVTDQPLPVGK